MTRLTAFSIAGVTLLMTLILACGTFALAVRAGVVSEQLVWLPPNSRYQVIVRVGRDALPWDRQSGHSTAINLWVHGRGTDWHIVNLIRVPLGRPAENPET
jgi:hypothetical protein